jgi:hypothetical protein
VGVGVDAEVVAGFHAVQFTAAAVDGADIEPRSVAAALGILGARRIARAAFIGADTLVAAFPHPPRALAAA